MGDAMSDVFFLVIGIIIAAVGLLLIMAKVFFLHTMHRADKCNRCQAEKRLYHFPRRKIYLLSPCRGVRC